MIETLSIIDQLVDIYFKEEWWHKKRLSEDEARKYHQRLLEKGNIITYQEQGELIGYVEYWRINFEQFGRLVCHAPFSGYTEDTNTGNICYVANTWIKSEFRNSKVYKILKYEFFKRNMGAEYFVGEALRKTQSQPIKVFKKSAFLK